MRSLTSVPAVLLSLILPTIAVGQEIPTPASVLGFEPGADFLLASYEESLEYFQRLDSASDRLSLVQAGVTSQGRPWYMALISSPENLAAADHHKSIAQQLADPESLSDAEARALAREGRAIVDISGGLHASEVAGAQHTIALAYELVASEDPRIAAIRTTVMPCVR